MATVLYLVRNAATIWSAEHRITGRRDIGLSPAGIAQAEEIARAFVGSDLSELVSAPTPRAIDTAMKIAEAAGIEVTRDPRLGDASLGSLEGRSYTEEAARAELSAVIQGQYGALRDRLVSSVSQLLTDNEHGSRLMLVSHATPIAILLAHYLGLSLDDIPRVRVSPGKMAILAFEDERSRPRLLGMDVTRED